MANLKIIEYLALGTAINGAPQIAALPPLAIQTVAITTETDSAALNAQTKFVELVAGADCCVKIGPTTATNAATTDYPMLTNDRMFTGVPTGGWIVSVISGSGL